MNLVLLDPQLRKARLPWTDVNKNDATHFVERWQCQDAIPSLPVHSDLRLELECHHLPPLPLILPDLSPLIRFLEEAVTGLGPLPHHTGSEDRRRRRSKMTRWCRRRRRRRRRRTQPEVGGRQGKAPAVHNRHFEPWLPPPPPARNMDKNYELSILLRWAIMIRGWASAKICIIPTSSLCSVFLSFFTQKINRKVFIKISAFCQMI